MDMDVLGMFTDGCILGCFGWLTCAFNLDVLVMMWIDRWDALGSVSGLGPSSTVHLMIVAS